MSEVKTQQEIDDYIKSLEDKGDIDPSCVVCQEQFYPLIRKGMKAYEIFAPRHRATVSCRSGRNNHCTCDTCF